MEDGLSLLKISLAVIIYLQENMLIKYAYIVMDNINNFFIKPARNLSNITVIAGENFHTLMARVIFLPAVFMNLLLEIMQEKWILSLTLIFNRIEICLEMFYSLVALTPLVIFENIIASNSRQKL